MARIALPGPDEMNPAQRAVYDEIVAGRRGTVVGPLRAALHKPEMAVHWHRLGEVLRYSDGMPDALRELAIITTGRRWGARLEFNVHAAIAREAGLPDTVIDAIRNGAAPAFNDAAAHGIYEFTRALLCTGQVPTAIYDAAIKRWGTEPVIELTALIGYYSMVAMTLNAHEIELPAMERDILVDADRLTELPPAILFPAPANA